MRYFSIFHTKPSKSSMLYPHCTSQLGPATFLVLSDYTWQVATISDGEALNTS